MAFALDVGCGNNKVDGAVGLDRVRGTSADVIANLDQSGFAFLDNTFDRVYCFHVIEHVSDVIQFLEEIHRVSRNGAQIVIHTPHASSAYSFLDPTHTRHLTFRSLDLFCDASYRSFGKFAKWVLGKLGFASEPNIHRFYSQARFGYIQARLVFPRLFRLVGIEYLANRFPDVYELYLMWIFPCRDLHFVLEVKK